jgi:hypothetical protein
VRKILGDFSGSWEMELFTLKLMGISFAVYIFSPYE